MPHASNFYVLIQNPDLETSSDPANNEQIKIIERHNNKWKDIIWDLKRLVLFGRDRKKQPLLDVGVDTFFTSLTFGDVRVRKFMFITQEVYNRSCCLCLNALGGRAIRIENMP